MRWCPARAQRSVDRVRAGQAIEPRNAEIGVPTLLKRWKAILLAALCASRQWAPRGRRTLACALVSMRENREIPCLARRVMSERVAQGTLRW
jgi:hypothetical protein